MKMLKTYFGIRALFLVVWSIVSFIISLYIEPLTELVLRFPPFNGKAESVATVFLLTMVFTFIGVIIVSAKDLKEHNDNLLNRSRELKSLIDTIKHKCMEPPPINEGYYNSIDKLQSSISSAREKIIAVNVDGPDVWFKGAGLLEYIMFQGLLLKRRSLIDKDFKIERVLYWTENHLRSEDTKRLLWMHWLLGIRVRLLLRSPNMSLNDPGRLVPDIILCDDNISPASLDPYGMARIHTERAISEAERTKYTEYLNALYNSKKAIGIPEDKYYENGDNLCDGYEIITRMIDEACKQEPTEEFINMADM